MSYSTVFINSIASYIPSHKITNHDLPQSLDTSNEWIVSHTGIHSRYIAAANENTSDLACHAAQEAIRGASITKNDIAAVIVSTSTPDYAGFPSTACVVQHKLNLNKRMAFDISAACSGFIYGVELSRAMICSNTASHILFICSEIFSRIVDWNDRSTCVLFGDAAAAVVLSPSPDNTPDLKSAIIDSVLSADGTNHDSLTVGAPPSASQPYWQSNATTTKQFITMKGKEVYLFAVDSLVTTIETLLQRNSLSFNDIDWVIPHQANVRIIEAACKRKNYQIDKFYTNIDQYANTSAASIPLALSEMVQKGLLKRGHTILTIGFGAGLTYGGNLIVW